MNVAAALRTAEGEEFLITHAGLSVPLWRMLDEPMTATTAAHLLNDRPQLLINDEAGPLWARNLHEPWLDYYAAGGFVPFGQIHGHSAIVSYAEGTFTCPGKVRQRATVDWERRQVRVRVGGRVFIGVDPKHGEAGAPTWAPLVLPGATLLG